ncbi:hypothetical protein K8T06_12890 [bacterium]|nr:hypothetical protein [bacterium]
MRKTEVYKRLPGRGVSRFSAFGGMYRLYLADDHLLSVFTSATTEKYKRFYYSDIQAFQVTQTRVGSIINGILSILLLICAIILVWFADQRSLQEIIFASFFLLFLPLTALLVSVLRGPTCKTWIHTPVQSVELPSLGRIKTARIVIRRIEPLLIKAQGEWSEDIDTVLKSVATNSSVSTTSVEPTHILEEKSSEIPMPPPLPTEKAFRKISGRSHGIVLALTVLLTISYIYDVFFNYALKNIIDSVFMIFYITAVVFALIQQRDSAIPYGLRVVIWVLLIISGVSLFAVSVELSFNRMLLFQTGGIDLSSSPEVAGDYRMVVMAISALVSGFCSLVGFIHLNRYRQKKLRE